MAAGSQLENDAAITTRAARTGGAVHGSSPGKNDVADGAASVASAFEAVEHTLFPCAVGLRRELIYGTKIICSIVVGCAVEIALAIRSQSAVGKSGVGLSLERVNCGELPATGGVGKPEGNALSICAARCGHAVEAPFITKQAAGRAACAIVPSGEGMDHFQVPGAVWHRTQEENDALTVRPAGRSHPVESAVSAECQAGARSVSVIAAGESMNHGLGPDSAGVSQLVSDAATALTRSTASGNGRAVEIALAVKRDALVRLCSVGASGEAVEDGVSPAVAGRGQLKDRA